MDEVTKELAKILLERAVQLGDDGTWEKFQEEARVVMMYYAEIKAAEMKVLLREPEATQSNDGSRTKQTRE